MSVPEISVIIPTYKSWEDLTLCLDALANQTLEADRFEIFVVNNDPGSPVPVSVTERDIRVLNEAAPGSYAARNRGLEAAKTDLLAFTDSDCVPDPEWLSCVLAHFKAHPLSNRVGGGIRIQEKTEATYWAMLHERHFALRQEAFVAHGWAATANMAARRLVFDAVGPFDASQMSNGDRLWGKAAQASGEPITYLPEAFVWHPPRYSTTAIVNKMRRTAGGKAKTRMKRHSKPLLWLDFTLRTPFRMLPRVSAFRQVFTVRDMSWMDRLRMIAFLNWLKWVEWVEHGRLLFTKGEARRE